MRGGAIAVNEAVPYPVDVLFAPLSFAEINSVALSNCPARVALTSTCAVQVAPAAIFDARYVIVVAAADGLNVTLVQPVPEVPAFGEAATCKPAGSVSVMRTPVKFSFPVCVLPMLNVSVETVFVGMVDGEKDLLSVGGGNRLVVQPVKIMLSTNKLPFFPSLLAFNPFTWKVVVPFALVTPVK